MKHDLQGFPHDGKFESQLIAGWTQAAGAGVPYFTSVEHGLLTTPSMVRWVLVCVEALAYVANVGDELDCSAVLCATTSRAETSPAFSFWANKSHCGIAWAQVASNPYLILGRNKTWESLDTHEGKFRLKCYAWK